MIIFDVCYFCYSSRCVIFITFVRTAAGIHYLCACIRHFLVCFLGERLRNLKTRFLFLSPAIFIENACITAFNDIALKKKRTKVAPFTLAIAILMSAHWPRTI
ncbi:hypothetical protein Tcan_00357 [Toxocara canis]|uniref:Uncharacterized protein n=1 Tax=Toxocara canis TaxID=6265 RepID=A0A0B2VFG3_TOXCA|nr:hypothetical protein Tcan_00357 [Toxocara canis]